MSEQDRDAQLRLLWVRCSGPHATTTDWTQLYQLVRLVLINCHAPELGAWPEERSTAIDEYFNQKIFLAMRPGLRGPDHCGALVVFFRRYLRDFIDGRKRTEAFSADADADADTAEENPSGDSGSNHFVDLDEILRYGAGRTAEQIALSAENFLSRLRTEKKWAWQMLRYSYFPDPSHRVPLATLAATYQIPSYHYRAGQLGINHKPDQGMGQAYGKVRRRNHEDPL